MMRSPSFSRRSSSVTITIRPAAMSATADSTESKGEGGRGHPDKIALRRPLSTRRARPRA
jgi:hypothetical protein